MSARCPHPPCTGENFIVLRPIYRWARNWRGQWARKRSGDQVMCCSCLGHSLATDEGLSIMLRPQVSVPNPQADDSPPDGANGKRRTGPRFADLGTEP